MSSNRVVVLGNSGFIGKAVVAHLVSSGVRVVGYSSKELDLLSPECIPALRSLVQSDDTLVIISALTPDRGRDVGTMVKNIRMIENLCAFLAEKPLHHVVYVSSDAVLADDVHLARETSCCDPSSFHGLMHLVRERALHATLKQARTPFWIARPCSVYGDGDTHNSYGPNRFVRTAKSEGVIKLFGNGEERRDHIHIDDVARLLGLGIAERAEGVMNLATGKAVSFMDAAQAVAEGSEKPVAIECSPRQSPVTHRHFDITELMKRFPAFRFTPFKQGIADMMKGTHGI